MSNEILKNDLFMDNASEALYEVISGNSSSYSMLICEAIDKDGNKYQVQLSVKSSEYDFVDNTEEMPVFSIDENNRLCYPCG